MTLTNSFNETPKIVNKTCNGKCSSCGECCADILPIDDYEIKKIKDYIKTHQIKECKHIPVVCNYSVLDLTCPFRDNENKKCAIYPVRPAICRCFICSQPGPDIMRNKLLFHNKKDVHSMRHEFFGGDDLPTIMEKLQVMVMSGFKGGNYD